MSGDSHPSSRSEKREITATIGEVIDSRYRITAFLGDGGMGSVYRAEHMKLRRPVALKLLHRDIAAEAGFAERFEREALAAGRIEHENCVGVSDFGSLDDGTLYLVMELVEGRSLGDVLFEDGRLAPSRALGLARQILRGLGHAHKAGVVHRDVKPDNIILSGEGEDERAKILDFGIAKLVGDAALVDENRDLTQVGTTVGTPKYMSPEQAFGKGVDGRADLYSLTVVLYAMLVGRAPFEQEEVIDLLMMHASKMPPPLSTFCPDLDHATELDELIKRGMAKKKDDRFADADEFVRAIDKHIQDTGGRRLHTPVPKLPQAPNTDSAAFEATESAVPSTAAPPADAMPRAAQTIGLLGAMPSRPAVSRKHLAIAGAAGLGVLLVILVASSGDDTSGKDPEKPSAMAQVGDKLKQSAKKVAAVVGPSEEEILQARADIDSPDLGAQLPALETLIRIDDAEAAKRLIAMAIDKKSSDRRKAARLLAEKLAIADQLNLTRSYSLDVVQLKTCDARREALLKLRKLRDPRALPVYKKVRYRMRGGLLGIGDDNTNACLKELAESAIADFEGEKK